MRLGGGGVIRPLVTPAAFDSATLAWVAAVVTNGGSVSNAREIIVDNLIVGLKTDGLFSKSDRLWLYAAENTPSALTDIVADQLATAVNAPTFTVDRGYTGDGATTLIDSNLNVSVGTPNYVQDSACFFAWNNTANGGSPGFGSDAIAGAQAFSHCRIFPQFTDTNLYWGINRTQQGLSGQSAPTGLYLANRTGSTSSTLDINGTQVDSNANASTAVPTTDFVALADSTAPGSPTSRQVCCFGLGAGLSGADRTNLYSRLRTYMTAVGVP